MNGGLGLLLRALRDPQSMATFEADTWDLVVRQASAAGLLGRLGVLARQYGIDTQLPKAVRQRIQAILTIAAQQQRAVRWELVQLSRTLAEIDGPVLLLKGAAYAAADLPPAAGRLFGDIDLMVPKRQIDEAESALMLNGWTGSHHSPYDQRYYRQWMHELPPMMHTRRRTMLDLHHNILPETARIKTRPDLIAAACVPLAEFPRFSVPAPSDLVLHSATHLFHEGEWEHGLRDLVDLDALLRAFGQAPGFWDELIARAGRLNLGRPLFYGLRCSQRLLETPIPAGLLASCPGRPGRRTATAMEMLCMAAFSTIHPTCQLPGARSAASALYVRSHWLRMPIHLLVPHLGRKFWDENIVARFKAVEPKAGDSQAGQTP